VKPDREIFEYWSQETGVHPTAAVFIDDNAENIATADALGFHTVHYTEGNTDVRARLAALGVSVSEA
jgi:2-haloacid dehalogenase